MTANPETAAYLASLEAYWAAAERGENDGSVENMPRPPSHAVAMETAVICAKAVGQLLDFKKTGVLPDVGADPSPESRLEATAAGHDTPTLETPRGLLVAVLRAALIDSMHKDRE